MGGLFTFQRGNVKLLAQLCKVCYYDFMAAIAEPSLVPTAVKPKERQTDPTDNGGSIFGSVSGIVHRRSLLDFGTSAFDKNGSFDWWNRGHSPLRILTHLPSLDPAVDYSYDKNIRLSIPPEGLRIVGGVETKGKGDFKRDDGATALLDDYWASLPDEIGGLAGLQGILLGTVMLTGMCCIENVPAAKGKGLARTWPVDPLTIFFTRPTRNSDLQPWQYSQNGAIPQGALYSGIQLNKELFFWRAYKNWVDDPYGMPLYATALQETIIQAAIAQDLKDAIKHNAWPRTAVGFDFKSATEIAVQYFKMTEERAKEFVLAQFNAVVEFMKTKKPDDDIIHDANSDVNVLAAPDWSSLPAVLNVLQQRLLWALKEIPVMMGLDASNSDSYNTVGWLMESTKIETLRAIILTPLIKAANLHFRLLGLPYKAKAEYEKLRVADTLLLEQARGQQIENDLTLVDEGMLTREDASVKLTGSGVVVADLPPRWEREAQQKAKLAPNATGNNAGQDQQSQKATRQANKDNKGK